MKGTLIEIKNNLQETTAEWMRPRIKSMTWNLRKKKTTTQKKKKKKRIQINEDSISSHLDNFKRSNICIIGVPRKRRERARNWKYI